MVKIITIENSHIKLILIIKADSAAPDTNSNKYDRKDKVPTLSQSARSGLQVHDDIYKIRLG